MFKLWEMFGHVWLYRLHSKILASSNFNIYALYYCPLDWTIHWNAVWQFSNITIYVRVIGKCKVRKDRNLQDKSAFNKNQYLVPWIGGQWCIKMLFMYLSNYPYIYSYVGKWTAKKHFNMQMFSNPGNKILIGCKIDEAKISECIIGNLQSAHHKVSISEKYFHVKSPVLFQRIIFCE